MRARIGYLIANDKQEFLAYVVGGPGAYALKWSTHPADALLWQGQKYARIVRDTLQDETGKLYVLQMIESESVCFVTTPPGRVVDMPPWLIAA